jgi:uncharacterized membrane protein YgdD (TMEM256/DUF423 family)
MSPTQPAGQRKPTWRWLALAAATLGFTAVLLGAAGSHAIDLGSDAAARRWNIALQIHFFQATALLALAACVAGLSRARPAFPVEDNWVGPGPSRWLLTAGWLQFTGTLFFSGSLYLRAAGLALLPGWITPLGGLVLLAGWLLLMLLLVMKVR